MARKNTLPPGSLPFEENAFAHWREITRDFHKVVYRALTLKERSKWIGLAEFADLRVFSAGYYEKAKGLYWSRQGLAEGVLIYCVAGRGRYSQGGRTWSIFPGQVLYCFPQTAHTYAADERDPWTIYWLHLSGDKVPAYERLLGLTLARPVLHVGIQPEIRGLFHNLFAHFRPLRNLRDMLAIQGCAQHLLGVLAAAHRYPVESKSKIEAIQTVIQLMRQSLAQGHDLPYFARAFGASAPHFVRLFRKLQGEPPMRFYNRLRIEKACELLPQSNLSIKEVAAAVGFDDPAYFSRLFKKEVGQSPEQYRLALFQ